MVFICNWAHPSLCNGNDSNDSTTAQSEMASAGGSRGGGKSTGAHGAWSANSQTRRDGYGNQQSSHKTGTHQRHNTGRKMQADIIRKTRQHNANNVPFDERFPSATTFLQAPDRELISVVGGEKVPVSSAPSAKLSGNVPASEKVGVNVGEKRVREAEANVREEEAKRRRAEEVNAREEEAKRLREEEAKRVREEAKRLREEAKRLREEEAKRVREEAKRVREEAKRLRGEEAKRVREEAKRLREEEAKAKEETDARNEQLAAALADPLTSPRRSPRLENAAKERGIAGGSYCNPQ